MSAPRKSSRSSPLKPPHKAPRKSFLRDRRGIAATEFALIAPALIFIVVGVLEMSLRFRASEEATRYVHQAADLIARESTLSTANVDDIYNASIHMMKPIETTENLDFDLSAIGFEDNADKTPFLLWRRIAGAEIPYDLSDSAGLGEATESVIRVGVRYNYESPITTLFGGDTLAIVRYSYTRPRTTRLISMDGKTDDNGAVQYFGN